MSHPQDGIDESENESAPSHSQTIKTFVDKLDALTGYSPENEHEEAEDFLLDYLRLTGASEIADAFERARNRGCGFWYA